MIKNKIDYKLINIAIIALIIFLLYQTGNLWIGVVGKVISLLFPFVLAFVIAYALYPFLKFLTNHKIPKGVGVAIILGVIIATVILILWLIFPMMYTQVISLLNGVLAFIKEMSTNSDFQIASLQKTITDAANGIIADIGKYATSGVTKAINISMGYLTTGVIVASVAIYLLVDMDKIRKSIKKYLKKKSKRAFTYVKILDTEMKNYLVGLVKIMFITLFEYSLAYIVIGHPNALLLGVLATISTLIPYFGGMMTNVVAAITAFVISPALFIKTLVITFILSAVDGYLIGPLVYGKTNNVHPLFVIMSVFIGGKLLGIIGIMASFPIAVVILSTVKYFKEDISDKIDDIKQKSQEN